MANVVLGGCHLDWLTVTTFERQYIDVAATVFNGVEMEAARRLQYEGHQHGNDDGTVFFGQGEQKGRDHYLMQASGLRADSAWSSYRGMVEQGGLRVTRIDIALTVRYDRLSWSQDGLFRALKRRWPKKAISYVESCSGPQGEKLATVYVGSRSSDRLMRVYEKVVGEGDIVLRCEVEFKSKRAQVVARHLLDGVAAAAILRHEVERLDVHEVVQVFGRYLHDDGVNPRVVASDGDTERWLVDQVLPALQRWVNSHGNEAHYVRRAFLAALVGDDWEGD